MERQERKDRQEDAEAGHADQHNANQRGERSVAIHVCWLADLRGPRQRGVVAGN
jgi:hypothetical protein